MPTDGSSKVSARVLQLGAVLVAVGVVLTACGSSSSGGTAAGGQSISPNVTTSPTVSSSTAVTPTTGSTAAANSGGSDSSSSFCTYAREQQAQASKEAAQFQGDTPQQLAAFTQKALAELEQFTSAAPSAIKSDVQVIVVADQKVFNALKQAGYDYKNVNPDTFASIDSPALTKASKDISTYLSSTCGVSTTG
jgi:hypothetical protein